MNRKVFQFSNKTENNNKNGDNAAENGKNGNISIPHKRKENDKPKMSLIPTYALK